MADRKRKIIMQVLIPMREGTELNKRVENSILAQSILVNINNCYAPGKKHYQRYNGKDRLINEPIARNKCKEEGIKLNEEIVVIQDDDIVQLNRDNYKDMQEFLINNL
jgi:hypothetical protein